MQDPILYESEWAKIKWDDRGFFVVFLKNETYSYDKEEAKRQFDFFQKITNGAKYNVIVDFTNIITPPTQEAYHLFIQKNSPIIKTAIVSENLGITLSFKHLIIIQKLTNLKLFKTLPDAVAWLINE